VDIEFCEGCDGSISRQEIESGEVVRAGGRLFHRACAPKSRAPLTWLPWVLLAPAVAVGFLLAALVLRTESAPLPASDGATLARLETVEARLGGLSAQVQATGRELRAALEAAGRSAEARDATLGAFAEDLDLLLSAIESLARTPPPTAVVREPADDAARLRKLLADADSDDAEERWGALRELFLRPEPEALRALRSRLEDGDAQIRWYAARLLGERGDRESAGTIVTLLRDEDPVVRLAAHRALQLLSGMPFEFDPVGSAEVRQKQAAEWERWWHERENGDD
jgi:hypothetical protein